ncbi:hypothetical protein D3C72_2174750 [compost metagenome]
MAVGVIDTLEMVDIQQQQAGRRGIPRIEILLQRIHQPSAIKQVCHGIARRHIAQAVRQPSQYQPDDGGRHDGGQG